MKLKTSVIFLLVICALAPMCTKKVQKDYPIKPVAFTEVQINDAFWLP